MTKYLGLFVLILSSQAMAGTNSMLVLRAIVPEVMKVEVKLDKKGPQAILHTNNKGKHHSMPKFLIKKHESHYLVSVTQP